MLNLEFFITMVAVIGNTFLGFFTFAKNPRSSTNRLFFLFLFAFSLYLIANYFALRQIDDISTFFWIKLVISIAVLINQFFFLFAASFPQNKMAINKSIFLGSILMSLVLVPLVMLGVVFTGVNKGTSQPVPGPGIILFLVHTVVYLGGGCLYLIRKYIKSTGVQKTQIRYLLVGIIAMFSMIGITNIFLVVILKTTTFVGLLPLYTLVFAGFTSYAIIRHRFLDIQMVVARAVAYTSTILIFGVIFSSGVYILVSLIFGQKIDSKNILIFVGVVFFIIFTRDPLLRLVEKITDKIFYRRGYNSSVFLGEMSKVMASTILLEELSRLLLSNLNRTLKSSYSGIYLFRDNKVAWSTEIPEPNLESGKRMQLVVEIGERILSNNNNNFYIFDELEESKEKDLLRASSISIAIGLMVKNVMIGILVVGSKESGNLYTTQDIDVVKILSPEIAVAINNSLAYEEIRKFNLTLKEEVVKATGDLMIANEKLKELDKLKDEFVSLASHELRTPMTVIKSYIWLLLQGKAGDLSEKQKSYLDKTYSSTIRLIDMVNDMLNISRIESGRLVVEPKLTDIYVLLKETVDEMLPKAAESGINLVLEQPHSIIPKIYFDPDRIKQVVINLIGNSLKFTPQGGSITVAVDVDPQFITTTVKDTGRGIKPEDMEKLFKKFNMLGNNYLSKPSTQGTGLGLYLSKSLIELHKGRIWVESEGENKGSVFSFTLPLVQLQPEVRQVVAQPVSVETEKKAEINTASPHLPNLQA